MSANVTTMTRSHEPLGYLRTLFLNTCIYGTTQNLEDILDNLATYIQRAFMAYYSQGLYYDDPAENFFNDATEMLERGFEEMEVSAAVRIRLNNFPYQTFWDDIFDYGDQIGNDGKDIKGPANDGPRSHAEIWMLGCALRPTVDQNASLRFCMEHKYPEWIRGLIVVVPEFSISFGEPVTGETEVRVAPF